MAEFCDSCLRSFTRLKAEKESKPEVGSSKKSNYRENKTERNQACE
jgi:hypothetical protein